MHRLTQNAAKPEAAGLVIHGAARYDFFVWLFTLGGERLLREKMLRLAELTAGENVLDIGCGTGTLAILAKRQVGDAGVVHGIDAAPEMIAQARVKAKRAGVELVLAEGVAQGLPLPDQAVDVVLSTLMLHHLPRKSRPEIVREIKRVLKPGGRLLAVDFIKPASGRKSFMDRFHRHGFVRLDDVVDELKAAGFTIARSGPVGERDLHFIVAANGLADGREHAVVSDDQHDAHGARVGGHRHVGGLLFVALAVLGALALMGLHGGAALSLLAPGSNPLGYAALGALVLLIVVKLGLLGFAHGAGGRLIGRWLGVREE
ncbi:MAG: methyltransferase domain-containing protein [Hyphomonadaceae bacterium]|nr:methyltransferase domain-containing protein [Hyphomonadaceae bacterium]